MLRGQTSAWLAGVVVDREDLGSWLDGPRSRTPPGEWRGQSLGMPPSGPGSIAGFGARLVAVVIDWGIAQLIAAGVFSVPWGEGGPKSFIVLAVFAVMNLVLVGTVGSTIGHRILGLQVRSLTGTGRVMPLQVIARTVLLCLFIPAVVWDKDGRGLHDKVPNTVVVRTR